MVYYENVIVNILWIFIVFVLKIISFLKKCVMWLLLVQMLMNKFIIKLPVPACFLFPLEPFPFFDFLSVSLVSATNSSTPSSFPVGSWLIDCWGVDVSWVLDSDAVRFEHGIL